MAFILSKKTGLKFKLATFFVLSSALLSLPVIAEESLYLAQIDSGKLITPILLDKSGINKSNVESSNISPYNLRKFGEEEYFTSVIEDRFIEKAKPPALNLHSVPQPSQYNVKRQAAVQDDAKTVHSEFVPSSTANTFFAPMAEGEVNKPIIDNCEKQPLSQSDVIDDFNKEASYYASASTDPDVNIDLEGRTIVDLKIYGVNTVDKEIISNAINIKAGDFFTQQNMQQNLQNLYSTGYFSDNMTVEPKLNADGTVALIINLEENILVSEISIKGNSVVSIAELMPFLESMKDKPQNIIAINEAVDNINSYYANKGYILASVISVDDDLSGLLSFSIQEGVINKINLAGNTKTKDYVITRNIMTQPGTVYNEEYLKRDLAKVFSTQIFEEVDRNISPSEENDGTFDITVVVKEKSTDSIALGGGIDTGLGAFGSISLREDNFLGRAQKVSLSGIVGSGILLSDSSIKNHMNYQVELSFFEPHFINADNSLMSKLYFREMGSWNVPLAVERRIGGNIGIEHKVQGYDNLHTSFMLGAEHINLKEGDFNRISTLYNKYNLNISERAKQLADGFFIHMSPGIRYSKLDNEEIPREGVVAQARFTESLGISDFNHTNGRLSGAVTRFLPVFKKSSLALTAKAGVKVHGEDMPEVMAYRLGGPYSIRGYRMNGVGSGDSFLMGSAELATPLPFTDKLKWDFIKKMRLTFFVDAGKVFDPTITSTLYDRPLHAITAGIGLRMYIPGIGPMSIDYGIPITNPGHNGSEHGYFTFGAGGMNGMYGYGY